MQLRCSYCQTMFPISHDETLAAIEHLAENNLKYYDAHCPNCRRANRVERFKLEASYPGWQDAIKTMTRQAAAKPVAAASAEKTAPAKPKAPAAKKVTAAAVKPAAAKKKPTAVKVTPTAAKKKPAAPASTSKAKKK
jgi:hypothetical protein